MFPLPRLLRFLAVTAVFQLVLLSLLRLAFWGAFRAPNDPAPALDLLGAFYLGLKFDLRLILLGLLPLLLLGWLRWFNPLLGRTARRLWLGYFALAMGIAALFYIFDFGHFAYLKIRLDATALRFLENPAISANMVWESYPVSLIGLGLVLFLGAYLYAMQRLLAYYGAQPVPQLRRRDKALSASAAALLVLFGLYGKFSWYPLRWSDAFAGTHPFASALSLNPVLYFYDTLHNGGSQVNEAAVREYYPLMADYLGVTRPDPEALSYARHQAALGGLPVQPNVVMVFLESFAGYKTGLFGNPLDPTPHFDALARDGLYFDRFYVPHTGTARSVFCAITGIPDVQLGETASRNPMIVDQHTVLSAFEGYEKFYFLGGSANWGNIRGVLANNIPDLHLYEEGSYEAPRQDVWGISDLDLFREANQVLAQQKKPFFAIIQTSGNHRPYTIPEDNEGFELREISDAQSRDYGFESQKEYNSFRFMDHSIGHFMQLARNSGYFDNTLFVFFADHGISGDPGKHASKAMTQLGLGSYHIPFVIYNPRLISPQRVSVVASELDILPTLASLSGLETVNTTFGRDLLDRSFDDRRYAFTILHYNPPKLGLVSEEFYYSLRADGSDAGLHWLAGENPRDDVSDQHPEIARHMRRLTLGVYETARYLLNHNSREAAEAFAAAP